MTPAKNVELLDTMYQCWRSVDLPGVLQCMSETCVYRDMALGESWTGHREITTFVERVWAGLAGFDVRYTHRFATDKDGAGAWTIRGRASGTLAGFTVSDAPVTFSGLSMYRFDAGKLTSVVDCWDFDELRRELQRHSAAAT